MSCKRLKKAKDNNVVMKIRPYEKKDGLQLQTICICNSDFPKKDHSVLLDLYCNYYIEQEPEHCLVLTDEEDLPAGYLYWAADFVKYEERYRKKYLHRIPEGRYLIDKQEEMKAVLQLSKEFPAHMHMDVLPEYQGHGFGRQLLSKAREQLLQEGVCGLMLIASAENTGACSFYERCGFQFLGVLCGNAAYGIRL